MSANIIVEGAGECVFPEYRMLEVGGVSVAVIGVTDCVPRKWDLPDGRRLVIDDPLARAAAVADRLRAEGACDLVVLLANVFKWKLIGEAGGLPGVDVIIGGDGLSASNDPAIAGGLPLCYAGRQGEHVGLVEFRREGEHWKFAGHELTRLEQAMPEDEATRAIVGKALVTVATGRQDRLKPAAQ